MAKMKDGLYTETGELVYYRFDSPYHAGLVKIDGAIYYIGKGGRAVKGEYVVHKEMTNGILPHGTYRFDEDGKLIDGYYLSPKVTRTSKKRARRRMDDKTKLFLVILAMIVIIGVIVVLGIFEPTAVLN